MSKLDNKIALVTGSSSDIGKAIALAFADRGAYLIMHSPNETQAFNATSVMNAITAAGRRAITVQADVSQSELSAL